jgi:hypothetical protein
VRLSHGHGPGAGGPYAVLIDTLNNEVGRFVSRSGTLRSVTPKLVSVWLAGKVLRTEGSAVADRIQGLPPPLPDRFKDQLGFLRDAPAIRAVVTELLQRPEFEDPARLTRPPPGSCKRQRRWSRSRWPRSSPE